MNVKLTKLKGMKSKQVNIEGCVFPWTSDAPYSIIMCLLGREDELVCAIGSVCQLFNFSISEEDHIAKLMFADGVTLVEIKYACDVCRQKDIIEISYFFGILNNLIAYNAETSK